MLVRRELELVVRRIRIRLPLQLEILAAHSRSGFRIYDLQVALEQMRRRDKERLVGNDVVLRRRDTRDTGCRKHIRIGIEDADSQSLILFRRHIRDYKVAVFISLGRIDLPAATTEEPTERITQ